MKIKLNKLREQVQQSIIKEQFESFSDLDNTTTLWITQLSSALAKDTGNPDIKKEFLQMVDQLIRKAKTNKPQPKKDDQEALKGFMDKHGY